MRPANSPAGMVRVAIAGLLGIASACAPERDCGPVPSDRPVVAAGAPPSDRAARLGEVRRWVYVLDVNLSDEQIAELEASDHELIVVDFIPSEANNLDFDMAGLVARMHAAPVPKLVVAYLDVGQAEDFRRYWDPAWSVMPPATWPAWIVAEDPDGWAGNYPCAYWDPQWQSIWLGDQGTLADVVAAGMDGIYLDWVEAYSDTSVIAAAQADGVDAEAAMVDWVAVLAAEGRSRDPDFLVIGQNAAELAAGNAEYRATIDALAQEQTWFDGAADGEPMGDCPLPATDDDIETDEYLACLPSECRRMHDDFPDSTLHVSTEGYLAELDAVRAAGLPVFTVDYALDPEHVAFVAAQSRRRGYVPYAGPRWLDEVLPAP